MPLHSRAQSGRDRVEQTPARFTMLSPAHQRGWALKAGGDLLRGDRSPLQADPSFRVQQLDLGTAIRDAKRHAKEGRGSIPWDWRGPAGQR